MRSPTRIPIHLTAVLLLSPLLLNGCTSSSSDDVDSSIAQTVDETVPMPNASASDISESGNNMDATDQDTVDTSDTTGADPQNPSTTQVTFNITVPAYVSDALQVRVEWSDESLVAQWVGDEFWSITADLPTQTQSDLVVTFFDDNGALPLGTAEQVFITGTNASQMVEVASAEFDTDRHDSNNNGVSNIDELNAEAQMPEKKSILLFSETRDYRHPSIEDALVALEAIAVNDGMQVDFAADSSGVFNAQNLANYDAVVWVLTSGNVLDDNEQAAFENYIRSGGAFVGIHAASDTEYEWPWYGGLVGAYFDSHPEIQSATQNVEDGTHPSTAHLNLTWTRTDEWYNFNANPRARVQVLLSLDEATYSGGTMNGDHPIAWYHEYDGGRAWYTGGGHTSESYVEPDFRAHLLGGLRYATGVDG